MRRSATYEAVKGMLAVGDRGDAGLVETKW